MAGETKCSYWAVISHLSSGIKVNSNIFLLLTLNKLTVSPLTFMAPILKSEFPAGVFVLL